MATIWRRAWQVLTPDDPTFAYAPMISLNEGETVELAWWSYQLRARNDADGDPLANTVGRAGVWLGDPLDFVPNPLFADDNSWMAMSFMDIHVEYIVASGAFTYVHSEPPAPGLKSGSMRRVTEPGLSLVLAMGFAPNQAQNWPGEWLLAGQISALIHNAVTE